MAKTDHQITIIDHRGSPWKSWFRTIFLISSLLGVGIFMDSQAMQWMGFFFIVLIGLGVAINTVSNTKKELTIAEARDYLDALSE